MPSEHEVVTLLLGLFLVGVLVVQRTRLRSLAGLSLLMAAIRCMVGGWVFTLLEEFGAEAVFNLLEHVCGLLSFILLALWVRCPAARPAVVGVQQTDGGPQDE